MNKAFVTNLLFHNVFSISLSFLFPFREKVEIRVERERFIAESTRYFSIQFVSYFKTRFKVVNQEKHEYKLLFRFKFKIDFYFRISEKLS